MFFLGKRRYFYGICLSLGKNMAFPLQKMRAFRTIYPYTLFYGKDCFYAANHIGIQFSPEKRTAVHAFCALHRTGKPCGRTCIGGSRQKSRHPPHTCGTGIIHGRSQRHRRKPHRSRKFHHHCRRHHGGRGGTPSSTNPRTKPTPKLSSPIFPAKATWFSQAYASFTKTRRAKKRYTPRLSAQKWCSAL